MGNYVLQALAQSHRENTNNDDDCAPVFDHIFMVAADVRQDIFDTALNDSNNSSQRPWIPPSKWFLTGLSKQADSKHLNTTNTTTLAVGPHFDFITNAGRDIAALARSKVHVLYGTTDIALTYRTCL